MKIDTPELLIDSSVLATTVEIDIDSFDCIDIRETICNHFYQCIDQETKGTVWVQTKQSINFGEQTHSIRITQFGLPRQVMNSFYRLLISGCPGVRVISSNPCHVDQSSGWQPLCHIENKKILLPFESYSWILENRNPMPKIKCIEDDDLEMEDNFADSYETVEAHKYGKAA